LVRGWPPYRGSSHPLTFAASVVFLIPVRSYPRSSSQIPLFLFVVRPFFPLRYFHFFLFFSLKWTCFSHTCPFYGRAIVLGKTLFFRPSFSPPIAFFFSSPHFSFLSMLIELFFLVLSRIFFFLGRCLFYLVGFNTLPHITFLWLFDAQLFFPSGLKGLRVSFSARGFVVSVFFLCPLTMVFFFVLPDYSTLDLTGFSLLASSSLGGPPFDFLPLHGPPP